MKYQVIVGNIGLVYDGEQYDEAVITYEGYVVDSKEPHGKASGEQVLLMNEGEVERVHESTLEEEE